MAFSAELAAVTTTRQAAARGAHAISDVVEAGEHVVAHHGAPEGRPGTARESTDVLAPLFIVYLFGLQVCVKARIDVHIKQVQVHRATAGLRCC